MMELFLGFLYESRGTPERFTVKPLLGGEKMILPSYHHENIIAPLVGVFPTCLEFPDETGEGSWTAGVLFPNRKDKIEQSM